MPTKVIDAHMHLNGSLSHTFLKSTANKNGCPELFEGFCQEPDLWKKFGFVNQIMQTLQDVTDAVVDVTSNSTAHLLEIRTTPKSKVEDPNFEEAYIQAFINGLCLANNTAKSPEHSVRGLLSIDRTKHTLEDAIRLIDRVVLEKSRSKLLVGIDLSGNFTGPRMLTGKDLYDAIQYGLSQPIGLALHVGEDNSEIESSDFSTILSALADYSKVPGDLIGKVRLGHVIYRTKEQDTIINKLQIPVEICPSCHTRLKWHEPGTPHPILTTDLNARLILPGTDDSLLFNCTAVTEQKTLLNLLRRSKSTNDLAEEALEEELFKSRKLCLFK